MHANPTQKGGSRSAPDQVVIISDETIGAGAAVVALTSIKAMVSRGIKVTLLNGHAVVDPQIERLGVASISFGGANLLEAHPGSAAIRGLFDHRTCAQMADWIAEHDTPGTIYHLHNWHKVLSPSIFRALRPVARRLVLSAHDYFLVCPNGAFFNFQQETICELAPLSLACLKSRCDRRRHLHKLWRVARQIVRARFLDLARMQATVLAVSEGMIPLLERGGVPAGSIRVLRNTVEPWRAERVRAERNRDIFFVGRLEEDKGIDLLARAARSAAVHLKVVGEGSLRTKLEQEFAGVELLGWRSRKELRELVAAARLIVVPTRWNETFSLVTFEALASGIPVLISRHALVADEVAACGGAEVFDPHDIERSAGALRRLLDDDAAIAEMSRRGFAQAPALVPSFERWSGLLLDLYQRKLADAALLPASDVMRPSAASLI